MTTPLQPTADPVRVLVVDDEKVVQMLLETVLAQDGCEVVLADTVATAISCARAYAPIDVALVDKNLPDGSGLDVMRAIKADQPDCETILMTGYASLDSAIEALHVGAYDYVLKPFDDVNDLRVKLRNAADKRRLRAATTALSQELDETQRQLVQAQKMEAVGRLAGGIAHDFNNLLVVILNYAQLAAQVAEDVDAPADLRAYLANVVDAGRSAAALTRQLLAFSRKQVVAPEVLSVGDVLAAVQRLLARTLPDNVVLSVSAADDLWPVKMDRGQLEQLVVNLVVNARDALPDGGEIRVTAANAPLSPDDARSLGIEPSRCVRLSVEDTGVGMAPEVVAQAFEPFFTTKPEGKGTGLGLATVRAIVDQAGGAIQVASEIGRGTQFSIYLPATEEPERRSRTIPAVRLQGAGETVLLVEDDARVRAVIAHVLDRAGYRAIAVGSAEDALSALDRDAGDIQLVLSDLMLPDASGIDVIERALARRPGLHAVLMSGYATATVPGRIGDRDIAFIAKPFTEERLLGVLREVLDS